VLFLDESKFNIFNSDEDVQYGEKKYSIQKNLIPTVKHGGSVLATRQITYY